MSRVKTYTNSTTRLLSQDLNNVQDDYEGWFSQYRKIRSRSTVVPSSEVAGTYPFSHLGGYQAAGSSTWLIYYGLYFDPAWYAVPNRSTKMRVTVGINTLTAPGVTITGSFRPITITSGTAGNPSYVSALGAATASVAFTTPAASSSYVSSSADVAAPTAGWYAHAVTLSGTTAAGSYTEININTEIRNV